ncbi:hypothetical protein OC842_006026 [Tilletia horrida]|uniref:Uncharacterized protein n=1 Tax=Tilletia horrida TaxID=155126 RepID=A0AAN6G6P7_9BASI|nr:hypothetical protein OC842_006026 [Tilletia horrida]
MSAASADGVDDMPPPSGNQPTPAPMGGTLHGPDTGRNRLASSTGSLAGGPEDFSQDDAGDEAAYAEHDDDTSVATRPPSRLSSRLSSRAGASSAAAADIASLPIQDLMQHPFVKDLISRLAARDQSFERLSQDIISKHPYVRKLLTHIADLSQKLLDVTYSSAPPNHTRQAIEDHGSPSPLQIGDSTQDQPANAQTAQVDQHKRQFYYRASAKAHFGVKSMASISIKDCIFTLDTGKPIAKDRFQAMRETAELEIKAMHKLPAVSSPYKNRTLGYYDTFAKPMVDAAVKTVLKEFPELTSKGDWKARGVIDYCLRLHRRPNSLYSPRSSSSAMPGGVGDEDDDREDDEGDDDEETPDIDSTAANPQLRSTVHDPASSTGAGLNTAPVPIASAVTAGTVIADTTLSATTTPRDPSAPVPQQGAAQGKGKDKDTSSGLGILEDTPDYSALAAILGRPVTLLNSAAQLGPSPGGHAQEASGSQSQPASSGASTEGQAAADLSSQRTSLIDGDTIDLDVGRFLCQSREPEFNMKSKRVTLKRKLRSFEAQQPFSQDDVNTAQEKAEAISTPLGSPQKGRRRNTRPASPSKKQLDSTRTPLQSVNTNADQSSA